MINFFVLAATLVNSETAKMAIQSSQIKYANISQLAMIFIIFFIFYFLLIRPQKRREKETELMRANIDIGDEIITIGGIIGTIVNIKDDFIVIETSGDRNKLRLTRWAIQTDNTAIERLSKISQKKVTQK